VVPRRTADIAVLPRDRPQRRGALSMTKKAQPAVFPKIVIQNT
jgi:hypothetical protein